MAFRRSVDPNVRRRRVLKDEPVADTDEAEEGGSPRRSRSAIARNYADAALTDHQPRITDLIPVRWWQHVLLFLLAVAGIAVVQSLFLQLETWGAALGRDNLTAFDLNQRGSIASWLSSLLLGGAFASGLLVFSIRRHKVTDYRGRYRVWILVPMVLLMGSLDAATGVRHAVRGAIDLLVKKYAPDTFLATHTLLCVATLAGVLAVTVFARMAVEMRRSRAAMVFLSLAAVSYILAVLGAFGVIRIGSGATTLVAESSMKLAGDLAVFFSTLTYARFVYLDAMGAIANEKPKKKKARRKATASTDTKTVEADSKVETKAPEVKKPGPAIAPQTVASHSQPPAKPEVKQPEQKPSMKPATPLSVKPGAFTKPVANPVANNDEDDEDDDADDDTSGLSRSERKRLKKLARREMRNAA